MELIMVDNVNHPAHYEKHNVSVEFQPIDIANQLGFTQGNAFKYAVRYKEKNGLEDLRKCRYYLKSNSNSIDIYRSVNKKIIDAIINSMEDLEAKKLIMYICSGFAEKAVECVDKLIQKYDLTFESECLNVLKTEKNLTKVTLAILDIAKRYVDDNTKASYDNFLHKLLAAYIEGSEPTYEVYIACVNVYQILICLLDNDNYDDLIKSYKSILENETNQLFTIFFGE